jgi:hypothetical protein|tara:strand:- start:306 stop:485 length:180 start_codon:yes stop_codon:yes gene_type:complete
MPRFLIAGNEVVEYEAVVEANSQEEAEEKFMTEVMPDLEPIDMHGWQWHETKQIQEEDK